MGALRSGGGSKSFFIFIFYSSFFISKQKRFGTQLLTLFLSHNNSAEHKAGKKNVLTPSHERGPRLRPCLLLSGVGCWAMEPVMHKDNLRQGLLWLAQGGQAPHLLVTWKANVVAPCLSRPIFDCSVPQR